MVEGEEAAAEEEGAGPWKEEEEEEADEDAGVAGTIRARGSPSFSHFKRVRCRPGGKGRVLVLADMEEGGGALGLLAAVVAIIRQPGWPRTPVPSSTRP